MKVTEQVKKELAVVAPPLTSAIKSSRKIKQVDLDEVRVWFRVRARVRVRFDPEPAV